MNRMRNDARTLLAIAFLLASFGTAHAQAWTTSATEATFNLSTSLRGPVIGPLHYGIFYEEINHAGDGGLYAELVRNGSMEENGSNPDHWWTIGSATFSISTQNLLNGAQKRAMHLNLAKAGDGTRNIGFWGINIVKGQTYRASLWLRTADGWRGDVTLTLESYEGQDLGHAVVHVDDGSMWQKYTAEITATGSYPLGWFAIRGSRAGTIYIDAVSLLPPTFHDRENGMRRDLAEKLAALHPRFVRFPGGCYIEGGNRYQWRHTVGPVEERLGLYNSHWGYPVSNGMGYHEFLQLAEDLGAEPLFVVNVGMGHGWVQDYQHIEGFIQEALDAIEYANSDVNTFWGAKRAAAGHPEPFNLRLMEIGNENYNFTATDNRDQSDHYAERYQQFYQAIKARWPEMTLIGNVESWGTDHPTWRNTNAVEVVDEHYYRSPDWFACNYHKYDHASRSSHKIYNGEYAVTQDFGINGTLKAALGEAIYMAGMERNSDVCVMASYAPIFMNENEAQWRPDMIHYNAYASFGTPSYWVQQMMASNVGHQNLTWTEAGNSVDILHAKLGLGSWGTDVTYSNIKVTAADGTVLLEQPAAVGSPASAFGTTTVMDVDTDGATIELDAVKNAGDEGFLIAFAHADGGTYAWWNLGGWGNGQHGVEQAVNGNKHTLASTSGTIETGRTYHIKIQREGLTARCYLDGKLVHTVTLAADAGQRLYLCAAINEAEDAAIVKVINYGGDAVPAAFRFNDATMGGTAQVRVMSHNDNYAENTMSDPLNVSPSESTLAVTMPEGSPEDAYLAYTVPAYSLSVITIPLADVSADASGRTATPPAPTISYGFEAGAPEDDAATLKGSLEDGAAILPLADGGRALYAGPVMTADGATTDMQGYLDLSHDAATAIGAVLNGKAYSVSLNIMPAGPGHLDNYCWAWNINNGTSSYAGLINQGGNQNWYFEKVQAGTCKTSSDAGLSQHQWHNITVSADATAVRLYIDGLLRGTAEPNANPIAVVSSTKAWLGRSPFAADARMTETFFDDLRFYDTALTPEQVRALYAEAAAKSTECPALKPEVAPKPNADAAALIGNRTQVDITSLLSNPDFADGTLGWEGTPLSAAPGTVAEHFFQLFDTYQVLPNMPAGYYVLEWQGFYRHGDIKNAYLRHTLGTEQMAEVYAATHASDGSAMQTWTDCAATPMLSLFDADAPYNYDPYTYPDNVATANTAFIDGHYKQQLPFKLTEMGDLRLGLRHFLPTVYDWACFDNFRLIYMTSQPNHVDGTMESATDSRAAIYDLAGRRVRPAGGQTHSLRNSLPRGVYIVGGRKLVKP